MRAVIAVLVVCGTARADHVLATAGAGASTSGTTATGAIELALGDAALSARGELGDRRATFLVGLAPRAIATTRWTPRCATTCATEPQLASDVSVVRRIVPLGGVRQMRMQTSLVLAARIYPTRDLLGDHVEVALTGIVAGRDSEFVQHARYMPGWYVAATWREGPIELGGEVGATGLETRAMDGTIHTDAHALVTLGLAVSR
ncbi:MAG TPA: hypothetical protein VF403_17560 [Kofleriaceae bacterium]